MDTVFPLKFKSTDHEINFTALIDLLNFGSGFRYKLKEHCGRVSDLIFFVLTADCNLTGSLRNNMLRCNGDGHLRVSLLFPSVNT
jgi:hypothetical protein